MWTLGTETRTRSSLVSINTRENSNGMLDELRKLCVTLLFRENVYSHPYIFFYKDRNNISIVVEVEICLSVQHLLFVSNDNFQPELFNN